MYCKFCGAQNPEDGVYCKQCGRNPENTATENSYPNTKKLLVGLTTLVLAVSSIVYGIHKWTDKSPGKPLINNETKAQGSAANSASSQNNSQKNAPAKDSTAAIKAQTDAIRSLQEQYYNSLQEQYSQKVLEREADLERAREKHNESFIKSFSY